MIIRLIDSPFFHLEKSYGALFISPGGPIGPGGPGEPGGPSEPRVGDPGGPRAPGIPGVPGSPGQRRMRKSPSAQYSASNFHILHTTVKSHLSICNRTAEYLWTLGRHQIQIVQVNQGRQENQGLPLVLGTLYFQVLLVNLGAQEGQNQAHPVTHTHRATKKLIWVSQAGCNSMYSTVY